MLLVRADSGIEKVSDLRGRALTHFHNPMASLASTWVETLLLERGEGRLPDFFGKLPQSSKLARSILPVFFRQSDACVVTRQGFETASELNPQVGRQLKVLAASEPLVPAVFCFRGDYHSPLREKLLAEIGKVNTTPAGQQFMTLFQCDSLAEQPESSMESAFALLARHQRLREEASRARPVSAALLDKPTRGEK